MLSLEACERLQAAGFRQQVDFLKCKMWYGHCGPKSGYLVCHGLSEINGDKDLKYEVYGPMYPCPNSDELIAAIRKRWSYASKGTYDRVISVFEEQLRDMTNEPLDEALAELYITLAEQG